jgi:aryl-phospho-beta-D-glucosidase BglC (GH1 family)
MIRSMTSPGRWLLPALGLVLGAAACAGQDTTTSDETAEVAVSGGGVTVDVVTTNVWPGGFNGAVRIINTAFPSPITSFDIVFRMANNATVTGTPWNGNITAPDGSGARTATQPSWMSSNPLGVGGTWDVGFNGGGTFTSSTIVSVRINGQAIPIGGGGDTTPPTASLSASSTSITSPSTLTLTATASDAGGVARVEFRDGGNTFSTDTSAPYSASVALTAANNGTHSYTARAVDNAGNATISAIVTVVVNIPGGDTTPPTVSLSASSTNITTPSTLALTATASDAGGVARVEFRDGGSTFSTDTSAPYSASVALTAANNGTHSYTARAVDNAGNAAISTTVTVVVNIPGGSTGYTTSGGRLFRDGVELRLFGLNWFGLETPDRVLHGLWTGRQLAEFLADFKSKGFNALRLPVSPQTINPGFAISTAGPASGEDFTALSGRDGRTALEYTLGKAQAAGVFVVIDFHTCDPTRLGGSLPGSPINCSGYSLDRWLADMRTLATLSRTFTNVVGIDLTNEPHQLTWSAWANLCSQGGQAVLGVNPNVTIWVEGVGNASATGGFSANWGGNLFEAGPISGIPANRLVFSPHTYGPSVAVLPEFSAANYPANMPLVWDTLFGRLYGQGFAVIPGEFGGHYTTNSQPGLNDRLWQDSYVTYLINKGTRSHFYWAVNPNSGDTGGVLLDDWRTWNNDKLLLLQRLR